MRKFLGNFEWSKYRVVKWVWPWCVYGSLLRFTTSISYDSTASTLTSVRKANSCFRILTYGPRHKQDYPKNTSTEMFWLLWCLTDRLSEKSGCMRVGVLWRICVCVELTQRRGDVGHVRCRCWASGVTSTDMLPLCRSNKRRRRKKRQKLWEEE